MINCASDTSPCCCEMCCYKFPLFILILSLIYFISSFYSLCALPVFFCFIFLQLFLSFVVSRLLASHVKFNNHHFLDYTHIFLCACENLDDIDSIFEYFSLTSYATREIFELFFCCALASVCVWRTGRKFNMLFQRYSQFYTVLRRKSRSIKIYL